MNNINDLYNIGGKHLKYYPKIRNAMELCIKTESCNIFFEFAFFLGLITYCYKKLGDKFPLKMNGLKLLLYSLSTYLLTGESTNRIILV